MGRIWHTWAVESMATSISVFCVAKRIRGHVKLVSDPSLSELAVVPEKMLSYSSQIVISDREKVSTRGVVTLLHACLFFCWPLLHSASSPPNAHDIQPGPSEYSRADDAAGTDILTHTLFLVNQTGAVTYNMVRTHGEERQDDAPGLRYRMTVHVGQDWTE